MLKAGLIAAAVGFVLALLGAIAFAPLCNPCAAVFVGIGAGVLAGAFSRPKGGGLSAGEGAKAGAIASTGNLVGQMIGAAVTTVGVDAELVAQMAAEMSSQFGFAVTDPALYAEVYKPMLLVGNLACGLVGIVLGAGLGAIGGLLWHQFRKQGEEIDATLVES